MTAPCRPATRRPLRFSTPAFALILILSAPWPGLANFVVTVQSVTAAAGSSNNTLDVTVTNNGTSAVTVGGFAFEITAAAGVTFTSVDTATKTVPYLFAGHSLLGPDISNQPPGLPGSVLDAFDLYDVGGSGVSLAANSSVTFGLGDVHFNVAAGATGPIAITLSAFPKTAFSNAGGTDITRSTGLTLVNGVVSLGTTSVPEPSSLALTGLALATGLGGRLLAVRRRRAR